MRHYQKNMLIFIMLCAALLGGCGGGSSPTPADTPSVAFSAPGTDAPIVSLEVTSLGECGALPGQWVFNDLATGNKVGMDLPPPSTFQKNFRKSWGGTTTAYAVWEIQSGDMPVWNEGRVLHVGNETPLTTTGMITSIALTGVADNMTALVGTDRGLVIADIKKTQNKWILEKQTVVEAVGGVRSLATHKLILEINGEYVTMVYVVAQDAVLIGKLDDMRAGFGCMSVAYQAKEHPVDPKDPANKRTFRPIKVVTQHSYAAFLTASRPAEEFANGAQLQAVLQSEWPSFQSTAYLIDLTRQNPVVPFIMTMGNFDRFFASDIAASASGIFLYGSRYNTGNPAAAENGIASYEQFIGTPIVAIWATVPTNLGGNFRMGRFDTNLANAYIRGLDRAAKVEGFLSGPTQQKWSVWKEALPFDYVRNVNYRLSLEKNKTDDKIKELDDLVAETPQLVPGGPRSLNWTQTVVSDIAYASTTAIINATATDVDFLDAKGNVVHQHVQDDGRAMFPLFENSNDITRKLPRIFHAGNYLFYVRHGNTDPTIHVFQDNILGDVDILEKGSSLIKKGPALMRFDVNDDDFTAQECSEGNLICTTIAVSAFAGIKGNLSSYRVDDIRMVSNPSLPNMQHFIMLVHSWNGITNNYRAVALQANLSLTDNSHRVMEIQGCSDLVAPKNNYSNNVSFGKPDDQSRFLGPLNATLGINGAITYSGYFQHFSPTYNVWSIKIDVTPEVVPSKSSCKPAGELAPLTDPSLSESLSAVLSGNAILGLHSNGFVRWKIDAKTTQYLDVGNNILGGPVTIQKGHIVPAGSQYVTQMDTIDGFHPTALFNLDGSSGEHCQNCQFTDIISAGTAIITANPERGIELFEFNQ